ncbi:unnamed protein product [Didymodactylos carnosus]|uniref:FAD-binding PCMH-type domain-containing protein n=1 Tax=Didymodactylos carnosus TaxID=1234261 RepID=A0A8S2EEQ3_9BILA|nr:unnamed protein product [Didymodactylos carnosus]CAF3996272.1 unnamed protein product [Didymodactylos carnosus]
MTFEMLNQFFKKLFFHSTNVWSNWAGNQISKPEQIFKPKTLEDLQLIIANARRNSKHIRCYCSGHTWSSLSVTNGYLLDMTDMNKISIEYNKEYECWTATVEPGVSVEDLDNVLKQHNPSLAVSSNVVLTSVRYGGIIATGCHGAGTNSHTIPDQMIKIEIVCADGELYEFSDKINKLEMSAARVNLGVLGIIYRMTLKVEPMFRLRMTDTLLEVQQVTSNSEYLKQLVLNSDGVEIFYFPFNSCGLNSNNDKIWIKTWERTNDNLTESGLPLNFERLSQNLQTGFSEPLFETMAKHPSITPHLLYLLFQTIKEESSVLLAPDALHYQQGIDNILCLDMEFIFKVDEQFSNVWPKWNYVISKTYELAKKQPTPSYPFNLTMEMRFIKSSQALLSPAYDQNKDEIYCAIEILSIKDSSGFNEFSNDVALNWISNGSKANPHWAKMWEHLNGIVPYIQQTHQQDNLLGQFNSIRTKYDPNGLFFDNKSLQKLFGKT